MFGDLRKAGILIHNKKQLSEKSPSYLREREPGTLSDPVMCTGCNGFYSKCYYRRHALKCTSNSCTTVMQIAVESMNKTSLDDLSSDFKDNILSKMRDDDIGKLVKGDSNILMIGARLYNKIKRKKDKLTEVRKSVRADMRRLAHLYAHFKVLEINRVYNNSTDMFLRKNFSQLCAAIETYTASEDCQKSGLKHVLCYLILNAAEKMIGHFLSQDNDAAADDIDRFIKLYNLEKNNIFGDAVYDLNIRRNKKLKKPACLPIESDVQIVRNFTIETMLNLTNDPFLLWDLHSFVLLRNCTCVRLTLFNARRGGEPARLLISDWQEADQGSWVDKQRAGALRGPDEQEDSMKITYQTGKGNNHLVPIMFPEDTIPAMRLLADAKYRNDIGIKTTNPYIFASGQGSESHCSGWHALSAVCCKLPISDKSRLTATTNRHRLSTLIASQVLPDNERNLFFDHMGHSESINRNIYQAPPAIMQLIKTGKHLKEIDEGR